VRASQTVTKYGKNGKPATEVHKEFDYSIDDKGVSWRSEAKTIKTTKFNKDGKPKESTTTDYWGKKLEETKYDKKGVKETHRKFRYNGTKESETDHDAVGDPTRVDYFGPKGKKIVKTKDYGTDGGYTMTEYRDNMDVHVVTKYDKHGNATESDLRLTSGGKVITIFKDGYPWKSIDYDENGKEIGERYHKRSKPSTPKKRKDLARETGDSTGIFRETGDSTGIFQISETGDSTGIFRETGDSTGIFEAGFDPQSMQLAVTPPEEEHHNP